MKRNFQRFLASLLIVCLAGLGLPVQAGMLPTDAAMTSPDRAQIVSFLDREDVRLQLQERGVSPVDSRARVAAMTDEEARAPASQIDNPPQQKLDAYQKGGAGFAGAGVGMFLPFGGASNSKGSFLRRSTRSCCSFTR